MAGIDVSTFEAEYACSVQPTGTDKFQTQDIAWVNRTWGWTGWTRREWPADVIEPGQRIYGFDLRKDQRRLFVLLRIIRGGSFSFRTMQEFTETAEQLTGRRPSPKDDIYSEAKWKQIEDRLRKQRGKSCTGIGYTFEVLKRVDLFGNSNTNLCGSLMTPEFLRKTGHFRHLHMSLMTKCCYFRKGLVAIPLKGGFPYLGWCNLKLPNNGMRIKAKET